MIAFAGVSHVAFTVTDLDASERFWTEVFDLVVVLDIGYGRVCMHPGTAFTVTLLRPDGARGGAFSELTTGLDHLGLTTASRSDLEEWERRLDALGVTYTPIRDSLMGHHLNFRDPDGIALELDAPSALFEQARQALAAGQTSPAEIAAFVSEHLDPQLVPRPAGAQPAST